MTIINTLTVWPLIVLLATSQLPSSAHRRACTKKARLFVKLIA